MKTFPEWKRWQLLERLRAIKDKGTRLFQLWRRVKEAEWDAEETRRDLGAQVAWLKRDNLELQASIKMLIEKPEENRLAQAERLLSLINEIAVERIAYGQGAQGPIQMYELRSWINEYRDFKRNASCDSQRNPR